MKILTIVKDLNMGGTQRVAQNLTIGLKKAGADVAVLARLARGPRERYLAEAGVPVFGPVAAASATLESLLEWQPDIVHIHRLGHRDDHETMLMQAFRRSKAHIVETNVFGLRDTGPGAALVDVHCHLSHWAHLKWLKQKENRERISTILPNAVDVDAFGPIGAQERSRVRGDLGVPSTRFLYGRIGQPHAAKWSPDLFTVFERACGRGADVGLLLVGAPEGYRTAARELPVDVRDRIIFIEPLADDSALNRYYGALDAFLHMSRIGESFGMVLCEAMLCEIPIITLSTPFRDNSQLEVVVHGAGGLTAADLDGMCEAMQRLEADPLLRAEMGRCGRNSVVARYAVPVIVPQALNLYRKLIDGSHGDLQPGNEARLYAIDLAVAMQRQCLGRNNRLRVIAFRIAHCDSFQWLFNFVVRLAKYSKKRFLELRAVMNLARNERGVR